MPDLPHERITIIGSGPAAWTAAIYAARADLKPLVFPGRASGKDLMPGGQLMLTTDVENYPGFPNGVTGQEMMHQFFEQAMRFGTRVVTDDGIKDIEALGSASLFQQFQNVERAELSGGSPFTLHGDGGFTCTSDTVVISTGAKANWLGLDNELRLAQCGGGVSACAVCDGALPMFRDQHLGVVGGGDTAIEEATHLSKFASKVTMFVRRGEMRASRIMQQRAENDPKIEIAYHTEVTDVLGDEKITGVELKNNNTGETSELELKGLFLAIGHTPITGFLDGQLDLDETGYIKLADPYRSTTNIAGVFAAGDVADHIYRQAITAAGMGCKAAIDAERWLAEHTEVEAPVTAEAHWH